MRNFKRILALVLSVIMIVGTFATVSAASTDMWYDEAVDALDGTGVSEIGDTAADEVTRNEFVLWIAKIASGQPSNTAWLDKIASVNFDDVDETHYQAAIAYAWKYGYIEGNGDGTFAPDKTISLAEACAIIVRLMGYEDKLTALTGQWDMDYITIAHWYCEAIDDVFYRYTDTFNPDYQLCKGEAAYLLANITNLFVEDEDDYVLTADDINLGQGLNKNSVVTVKTEGYIIYQMNGKANAEVPFVESKSTQTGTYTDKSWNEIKGDVVLLSVDGTKLVTIDGDDFLKALRVSLGLTAEPDYFNAEEAEINPFDYVQVGSLVNFKTDKAFTATSKDPSVYDAGVVSHLVNYYIDDNYRPVLDYEVLEIGTNANYKDTGIDYENITHLSVNNAAIVVDTYLRGNALLSSVTAENAATWIVDEDNYIEVVTRADDIRTPYVNEKETKLVLVSAKLNFNGKNYDYNYGGFDVDKTYVKIAEANYSSSAVKEEVTAHYATNKNGEYMITNVSQDDIDAWTFNMKWVEDLRYTYKWEVIDGSLEDGNATVGIYAVGSIRNYNFEDCDVEIYDANWSVMHIDEAMYTVINAAQGESYTVYYDNDGDGDVDVIYVRNVDPFRIATTINTATSKSYVDSLGNVVTGAYTSNLPVGSVVIGKTVKGETNTKDTAYTITDKDNSAIQLVLVGSGKIAYDFDDDIIDADDYAEYDDVPAIYQDYYTLVDVATIQSGIITNAPVARDTDDDGEVDYFVARVKLADETVVSVKIPALPLDAEGNADFTEYDDTVTLPVTVNGITADWTFKTTQYNDKNELTYNWMSFITDALNAAGNIYETNDNDVKWANTAAWMAGKYVKFAVNADNEVVFIQSTEETGEVAFLTGVTKTDKANIYKATIATYDSDSSTVTTYYERETINANDVAKFGFASFDWRDLETTDPLYIPGFIRTTAGITEVSRSTGSTFDKSKVTLDTNPDLAEADMTAQDKVYEALIKLIGEESAANWDKYTKVETYTDVYTDTYLWKDNEATDEIGQGDEYRMLRQVRTYKTYKFTYATTVVTVEMPVEVTKYDDKNYTVVSNDDYVANVDGSKFVVETNTTKNYFIGDVKTVEVRASASGAFDYVNTAIYNKIFMSNAVLDTFETDDETLKLTGAGYTEIDVIEDLIGVKFVKDSDTGYLVYLGVNSDADLEAALGIDDADKVDVSTKKEYTYKYNTAGKTTKFTYCYLNNVSNVIQEFNTQDEWITLGTSKEALAEADQKLNFLGGERVALDRFGNEITAEALLKKINGYTYTENDKDTVKDAPYNAVTGTDWTWETLEDVYNDILDEDSQEAFAKSIAGYETKYTAVRARNPYFARTYTAANGFTYSVQYKEVVHTDALVARVMHVVDGTQTLLVPVYNADSDAATDFFVVADEEDIAEQIGLGRYVDKDGRVFTYLTTDGKGEVVITYQFNNDGTYKTHSPTIKDTVFDACFDIRKGGVVLDETDDDAVRAYALANGYKDTTIYDINTTTVTVTTAEKKFKADLAAFDNASTITYTNVPFANNTPLVGGKNFDYLNQGETATDSGEYKAVKPVANFEAKKLTKDDTGYFPGAYTVTIKNNVSESKTFNVTKDTLITVIAPKNGTAGIEVINTTAAALVEAKSSLFVTGWQTNEEDEYLGGLVLIAEWLTEEKPVEEIQEEYQIVYLNANAEAYIEFDNESLTWDLVSDMEAYDVLTAESVGVIRIQYNTVTEAEIAQVDLTLDGGKYYYIDEDNNVKGIVTDSSLKGTGKITAAKVDGTVTAEKINSKDFNSYKVVFAYIDQTTGALTLASDATNVVVVDKARYEELVADAQEVYDEVEAEYDEKIELVEKKVLSAAYVESVYGTKLATAKEKLDTTLAGYMTKYVDGQFWGYYNSAVYNWFLKQATYQSSKGLAFTYIAYEDTIVVFTDTFDYAS